MSLSARRVWIVIPIAGTLKSFLLSLSARRVWIEIYVPCVAGQSV